MSMDDQYELMQRFEHDLREFNFQLKRSMSALEDQHEAISPLWQDSMRREYDAVWGPFEETMKKYIDRDGPNYVEFLNIKLQALGRFLYG